MYRCAICQVVVSAGRPARYVVLESRSVTYPMRENAQRPKKRNDRRKTARWKRDRGGRGYEIAREVLACSSCAGKAEAEAEAALQARAFESDAFESLEDHAPDVLDGALAEGLVEAPAPELTEDA